VPAETLRLFGDPVSGKPIVIVSQQIDNNEMKMWTNPAITPEQWVNYAKRNFDQAYKEGVQGNPKMMSLGLHLRIIGRPGRIWALQEFFRHVAAHKGVWVTTRQQIAQHFAKAYPL
jgi:allantoinase